MDTGRPVLGDDSGAAYQQKSGVSGYDNFGDFWEDPKWKMA